MKHLLIAAHEFPPHVGGAGRFAEAIAASLSAQGVKVTVLTSQPPSSEADGAAYERRVIRVPRATALAYLVWRRHISEAVRQWSPTAVLATDLLTQRACAWLPAPVRRRCAVLAHGSDVLANFAERWPKRRLFTRLYEETPAVIANSRYTQQLLIDRGVGAEKIGVLHPWIEPVWWQRRVDSQRVRTQLGLAAHRMILTVGRLSRRKGQDAVIRALPAVRCQVPEAVYVVVGTGEELPRLQALARACGVEDAVRFAGTILDRDGLMDYYDACDLFVLPARQAGPLVEGFGIVLLEAQARGKPVVAGRSGGVAEALQDGITGRLVDPDRPEELVEAMVSLLTNRAIAERFGTSGRRWVSETFGPAHSQRVLPILGLNGVAT